MTQDCTYNNLGKHFTKQPHVRLLLIPIIILFQPKFLQLNQIYLFPYILRKEHLVASHAPKPHPEIRLIPNLSNVIPIYELLA